MDLQATDKKLSSQTYWDEVLTAAKLPRINTSDSYLYSVTMKYIDGVLSKSSYQSFFEVGCGSSGWLPYFAKKYGYLVSGLDYSEVGCVLARKNLELLNVPYHTIYCEDIFHPNPTSGEKFDIVFSYGVIEHFSDPHKVIEIFKTFTLDNGILITLIPNFTGLAGKLTKYFIKDIYDIHNVITSNQLASYHADNGLKILKNGYAGAFAFGVIPWIQSNHWLLRKNTLRRKGILFMLRAFDRITGMIFKALPFDIPSSLFSPYVICIAKKDEQQQQ